MFALVLTAVLGAGDPATKPADSVALDGNWTVICFEKDGMPVAEAKDKSVTFKNNMVSFTGPDAKTMKSMRIEFGARGKIRVTETDSNVSDSPDAKAGKDAKMGHYILTRDFLAICLHDDDGKASAGGEVKPASGTADQTFEAAQPRHKTTCTMILKRSDSPAETKP